MALSVAINGDPLNPAKVKEFCTNKEQEDDIRMQWGEAFPWQSTAFTDLLPLACQPSQPC
jgi:hypothetical protein